MLRQLCLVGVEVQRLVEWLFKRLIEVWPRVVHHGRSQYVQVASAFPVADTTALGSGGECGGKTRLTVLPGGKSAEKYRKKRLFGQRNDGFDSIGLCGTLSGSEVHPATGYQPKDLQNVKKALQFLCI